MNVMLDLETMGVSADSAIISIGVVHFNKKEILNKMELFCDIDTQKNRTVRNDTMSWWLTQSEQARNALSQGMKTSKPLITQLIELQAFIKSCGENVKVWGNGSDFDNAMLAHAYSSVGIAVPWKFWNNRCYRTIKAICNDVPEDKRIGTYHSAVDDAEHQARHLMKISEVYHVAGII